MMMAEADKNERARLPGFYKYSISERLRLLYEREWLSEDDYHLLMDSKQVICSEQADRLIENVIGVFGMPIGLGLNFLINGRDYVVPLVVEEPSILAAVSSAAKLVREAGGFRATSEESLLIGQIQVVDVTHSARARSAILQNKHEILELANQLHPKMKSRGGGAKDLEVMILPVPGRQHDMVVVHLLVDTCDAMGANLVNTMCEGVAPLIEKISGGRVFLRILSNLTDRSLVRAEAVIPPKLLATGRFSGEEAREALLLAGDFAAVDPYRAATHNKGIMNGIDAVAIATGNDWRAIEAAAHAYAGRGNSYTSLTRWSKDEEGNLVGSIELPLKVGIVGGSVFSNPAVALLHRILKVSSARELAEVMAAVGLAQNFAAIRALSTEGIQRGHMTLHARQCAVTAGTPPELFDKVVERLIESGEIKTWKAQEIIAELQHGIHSEEPAPEVLDTKPAPREDIHAAGHGKVILLGEHAVVYGRHALAAPIPLAVQARVEERSEPGVAMLIPRWGVEEVLEPGQEGNNTVERSLALILKELGVRDRSLRVEIYPHVPRAMGLGSSASLAVATIRGIARFVGKSVSDDEVNRMAFACEQLAHGTPSGVDNTLATYGRFTLFKRGEPPQMTEISSPKPIPLVVGMSNQASFTSETVGMVRRAWEKNPEMYERIFTEIDGLTLAGVEAIKNYDLERLGELMNVCHGLLNALQLSTWELEELVGIARKHGALGAKLTGGGGGGAMIAVCPPEMPEVRNNIANAMRAAGYRALITEVG